MIIVKPACEDDSDIIFAWRDDELTREMSITTDLVELDEHKHWFKNTLKSDSRLLLMCHDAVTNEKICVVRFDLDGNRALVSINLSPSMRGKGLAKSCLTEAIIFLKKSRPLINHLEAEIKRINQASISTFKGVGFSQVRERLSVLHFQREI